MDLSAAWTWKPAGRVMVNGGDITDLILPRLVSVSIEDTAGIQSDRCEIVLSDHMPLMPLAIPPAGAELSVALGYALQSLVVGLYVVEDVEVAGPPGLMRITGYAAAWGASSGGKTALTEQRNRSWPESTTVGTLVRTIAGETGFEPAVSEGAASISLAHLDQIDESDANLLSRVARDNGLVFKPGGGKLVMVKSGESTSASGQAMPAVVLKPSQVTRWRMQIRRREAAEKVVATYRDLNGAATVDVEVDGAAAYAGEDGVRGPVATRRLRRTYPTEAAARAAAKAELDEARRKSRTLTVDCPGNAALAAEGRLIMAGFRSGVAGEWAVTEVRHSMDASGFRSSVTAELPA